MRTRISPIAVITGVALALLAFAVAAGAAVIYVKWDSPQDGPGSNWGNAYHSIQDGIDAATIEDVWVARGTYSEHITLKSDIQVYGGFAGNETALGQRPAFPRSEPDPYASIIDGGNSGRCVLVPGSTGMHTAIDGFTIQNGEGGTNENGAGIRCEEDSFARITNNLIRNNLADYQGGGIRCDHCSPIISDNVFEGNDVRRGGCLEYAGAGGAIYCHYADAVISGNTFNGNHASEGGAIYVFVASPYISDNTFISNTAECRGGAVHIVYSGGTLLGNVFKSNEAVGVSGGAIYLGGDSSPTIQNNVILDNTSSGPGGGGGIDCWSGSPAILNNTIAGNSPEAIRLRESTSYIRNNIIAFNDAGIRPDVNANPAFRNNDVYGNTAYNYSGGLVPGDGDISVNPLFLNYWAGDLHLSRQSPCIDAGYDDPIGLPVYDMDGQPRVNNGVVDIGADEFWSKIIHVSQELTSSDSNSGDTWATAKLTIAGALSAAVECDQIWVAHGTYNERIGVQPGVELYGGFGGAESTLEQREPFPRPGYDPAATIIDGASGGTVVTFQSDATQYTKFDGFTITHGSATLGGGISCAAASPSIVNSTFVQNFAHEGAAIYLENASPVIEWCRSVDNIALYDGGAIYACSSSSPTIRWCVFDDCQATNAYGGGIYCDGGGPVIVGSTIANCTAGLNGGAIYCTGSDTIITNNTLFNNTATNGGGIAMQSGSPKLYNNIVASNSSGIYGAGGVTPELHTNDVWGNGGADYSGVAPGAGDFSVDPGLAAPDYGDFHLRYGSQCINAGADTGPSVPNLDLDKQERPCLSMDVGADEWWPGRAYRVRTDGDDDNSGFDWDHALRTIGTALAKCIWGDTVDIRAGTYNERITLRRGVKVFGGFDGETIIDGGAEGSVVTCEPGLDNISWLSSVTLTNGHATYGGGINCTNASPVIDHVTVGGCTADEGGGIYVNSGSPSILHCQIWENQATNRGGGIHCANGSSPLIRGNIIHSNETVTGDGGGAFLSGGAPIVHANMIMSNTSALAGGGIRCWNSTPELRSNVIWDNAALYGAGIHIHNGDVIVANNTITDNWVTAGGFGGGIDADGAQGHIYNNIVAFNSAGIFVSGGSLTFDHNDVYANFAYAYSGVGPGTDDLAEAPLFVDRLNGDCHLLPTSPCINAGSDDGTTDDYSDIDFESRKQAGVVDIGADEVQAAEGIAAVRTAPNGSPVHVPLSVVTGSFDGSVFYIEVPSRACGIRVESPYAPPSVGDQAWVWGRVWVNGQGERYIDADGYAAVTSTPLDPLVMPNRSLGGSGLAATDGTPAQAGVKGGCGVNTIGLLVRTCGTVTGVGYDWLYIDDGSGLDDGGGDLGVQVWAPGLISPEMSVGTMLAVTGVCTCYKIGVDLLPMVRVRDSADIQIFEP